jgi:mannose-6-phosphate isomerase-like protein (cupin superfamily)
MHDSASNYSFASLRLGVRSNASSRVVRGQLQVETCDTVYQVPAGQAIYVASGEWVRYSTPGSDGAEYIAVCLPAFSPETVNRDKE